MLIHKGYLQNEVGIGTFERVRSGLPETSCWLESVFSCRLLGNPFWLELRL